VSWFLTTEGFDTTAVHTGSEGERAAESGNISSTNFGQVQELVVATAYGVGGAVSVLSGGHIVD
jgi:hypothetical protein